MVANTRTKLELLEHIYRQQLIPEQEYRNRRKLLLDIHRSDQPISRDGANLQHEPRRPSLLQDLEQGMEIGPEDNRFRLMREIGGGGMGRIWAARDLSKEDIEGGRHYKALKVIAPQLQKHPRALGDLKREAIRAAELSHPNIINVYGWRQGRDGWLFVVMDYLEGRDLDQLLLDEGNPGLDWMRMLELLHPMVAALDHAHREHRLVHRDLKLGNVFITDNGVVKILDFGLAFRLHHSSAVLNAGKPGSSGAYLAPEVQHGEENNSISQDIYALACMTYEMLTGDTPDNRATELDRYPKRPEKLTDAAWKALCAGFAHRPQDRPPSAVEFLERLVAEQSNVDDHTSAHSDTRAIHNIQNWPAEKLRQLQQQTAAEYQTSVSFRDRLDDSSEGPTLQVIPAGEFLMGSPRGEIGWLENERHHRVLVVRAFAIGKYAVTFKEYDHFARVTGLTAPQDEGWGRDQRPVINVSWYDALAYARWLSVATGERYRLPTEAEWEYAGRAGVAAPFFCGATITTEQANYDGNYSYCNNAPGAYREQTVEVGQFPGNTWGLYDMHGNVWEWTYSEYDAHYSGKERLCAPPERGGSRVIRGGSWSNSPWFLRFASRFWYHPELRNYNLGFRLLREL